MWKRFRTYEPYFFYLVVLIHLFPLFSGSFFPTLDGPSHLYNARLINDLLFGAPEQVGRFFAMNPEPVPNWTGHFLLALFKSFLPAYLAEKVLLILYVSGLAFAFRYLLHSMRNGKVLFAYLFLPFIYHELFFVGFYNFCLGLIFLFWTLGYYQGIKEEKLLGQKAWGLFILLFLTYFSHLFAFATALLYIGVDRLYELALRSFEEKGSLIRKLSFRWYGELMLALALPGMLMLIYFLGRPVTGEAQYLPFGEKLQELMDLGPLIGRDESRELPFTRSVNLGLLGLILLGCYGRFRDRFARDRERPNEKTGASPGSSDHWFIAAFVLLILYFIFPDSNGSAGVISPRFCLLFFLFLLLGLSTLPYPRWVLIGMIPLVLYPSFRLGQIYVEELAPLQRTAWNAYEMSRSLEEGSVVLPVNRSNDWDHHHFANYLGVEGSAVILENYEADKGYFPVIWNEEGIPDLRLGGKGPNAFSCIDWQHKPRERATSIDYILVLGAKEEPGPCHRSIDRSIERSYEKVQDPPELSLYRKTGKEELPP